jgi:hypothetical protein
MDEGNLLGSSASKSVLYNSLTVIFILLLEHAEMEEDEAVAGQNKFCPRINFVPYKLTLSCINSVHVKKVRINFVTYKECLYKECHGAAFIEYELARQRIFAASYRTVHFLSSTYLYRRYGHLAEA